METEPFVYVFRIPAQGFRYVFAAVPVAGGFRPHCPDDPGGGFRKSHFWHTLIVPYLGLYVNSKRDYLEKVPKLTTLWNMTQISAFTDQVIKTIESTRQEVGMTTQDLIQRSGIRRSTFFRKMRGDTSFTTEDIDALAKALDVDPFLFLGNAANKADEVNKTKQAGVDPSQLPDDEKIRYVLDRVKADDQTLAASTDPDKEREEEGGDGR